MIVPSFTFYATAEAVAAIGAPPGVLRHRPDTFCVTRETVEAALTPATKAIVPVHLFGNVAPMPELRELGPPIVLEDAAQAAGAAPRRHQGRGPGRRRHLLVLPLQEPPLPGRRRRRRDDHDDVAERARRLRFHGSKDKVTFVDVGYNSRLDELQAAALRVLLPELDGWNAARRGAAEAYERAGLAEHAVPPRPVAGAEHVYHLYVARHERADEAASALGRRGIGARGYYRVPVHRQPAMAEYAEGVDLPVTEEVARTHLALPMGPLLTQEQVQEVVGGLAPLA